MNQYRNTAPYLGALASLLLLASAPVAVAAEDPAGYVQNTAGNFVRDSAGNCVHITIWDPEAAHSKCNPMTVSEAALEPPPEPKRVTKKISLAADAYFAFDKAELKPEGQRKLDEIVDALRGRQDARIQITGYTDQIGSERYNEELSRQRAEVVQYYLTSKGIPTDIIQTAAMGEANPVVTCEGKAGSALVECLAPNRRTEIEFSALEISEEPVAQ